MRHKFVFTSQEAVDCSSILEDGPAEFCELIGAIVKQLPEELFKLLLINRVLFGIFRGQPQNEAQGASFLEQLPHVTYNYCM
jgi:hypothetical protein